VVSRELATILTISKFSYVNVITKGSGIHQCFLGLDKHCYLHLTFINSTLTKQLGPHVSLLTITTKQCQHNSIKRLQFIHKYFFTTALTIM